MSAKRAWCIVALAALVACGSSDPPTIERYLGSAPAPPARLAALRIGMTIDQARAAVPGLALGPDGSALVIASGHPAVTLEVPLDPAGEIDRIEMTISMPATGTGRAAIEEMTAELSRAWGAPIAVDFFDMPVWASTETGWRVTTDHRSGHASATFFAHRDIPPAVLGGAPRLPGPLASASAAVRLGADADVGRHLGGDGVRYKVVFDHAPFGRIDLTLPAPARATVRAAWPGGVEVTDSGGRKTVVWFDPERRWRITLELEDVVSATLTFERYLPVAALIGTGPADAIPEVQMIPDGLDPRSSRFWLPPTEWEPERTAAFSVQRDAGVGELTVIVSYRDEPGRDALLALFARRWQPATVARTRSGEPAWVFRTARPRVRVTDNGQGALELAIAPNGDEFAR